MITQNKCSETKFDSHQDNGHKHTKMPQDYILGGKLEKKIQMSCIKPK